MADCCLEIPITPDLLEEIQSEAHESTLDAIFQFDLMTKLGYKLNFLTGEFE